MDGNLAIKVEHVSKKYCRYIRRSMGYGIQDIGLNLLGMSTKSDRLRKDEFWAVDDVSFEVHRGETLGIMGRNGSGKSTILKMLNGIFMPDKGRIEISGRVGALIEIGAGFHPMLTGKANIYINGAILGMSKQEINRRFNDIVEFAGIGNFIDTPVKNYSSGMYVRLGFAVAVHSEPDILLVDEVLSVGDREFQAKCFRKMHELKKKSNVSIILISHNEYVMREFAGRCIVMNQGKVIYSDASEDAISFYINKTIREREAAAQTDKYISKKDIIREVTFSDRTGKKTDKIPTGGKLVIDFYYESQRKIKKPIFGIAFYNSSGVFAGFQNSYENVVLPDIQGKGRVRVSIDPLDFPIDSYSASVSVCEEEESNVLEWGGVAQKLIVERPNNTRGLLKLKQTWEVIPQ